MKIEVETCIKCNKYTSEPKNKRIEFRDNYVEGAGQLCPTCYGDLYRK